MKIFIDTREKLAYSFKNSIRKTLSVGDYTTTKLKNFFCIERKSPGDLYGTLLSGHSRFRREIFRARDRGITLAVYVETTEKKFYAKNWPGGGYCKFPSETIRKCIATMTKKYNLEFNWCKSRTHAKQAVLDRLTLEEKKLRKSKG